MRAYIKDIIRNKHNKIVEDVFECPGCHSLFDKSVFEVLKCPECGECLRGAI